MKLVAPEGFYNLTLKYQDMKLDLEKTWPVDFTSEISKHLPSLVVL